MTMHMTKMRGHCKVKQDRAKVTRMIAKLKDKL